MVLLILLILCIVLRVDLGVIIVITLIHNVIHWNVKDLLHTDIYSVAWGGCPPDRHGKNSELKTGCVFYPLVAGCRVELLVRWQERVVVGGERHS